MFLVYPGHIATHVWYRRSILSIASRLPDDSLGERKSSAILLRCGGCLLLFWKISKVTMTNTWSNEKIIDFINEIHVRPELWNVETGIYKDRNAKKDGWAVIAEKFNITSDEAYKKFRSLRTYAKNEERKKIKSGSGGTKPVKWFAFEAISFILSQDTPNTGVDSENSTTNVSTFIIILHTD